MLNAGNYSQTKSYGNDQGVSATLGSYSALVQARRQLRTKFASDSRASEVALVLRVVREIAASHSWLVSPERFEFERDDSGGLCMEWSTGKTRLGFTFGPTDRDSGFYFAAPDRSRSGPLERLRESLLEALGGTPSIR